ncbi:MAG: hypothetical protein H6712_34755 [Myxococcales bacterium]|nr:hypothetical protein [Myxococcales bacterium]
MSRRALALALLLAPAGCEEDPPCERSPGYLCPVIGTGELGFNRDGLDPAQTDLFLVSSVRRGPDDRIYVMDFNNQRLRVIDDDDTVQTVIGSGFHAIADTSATAATTPLENPIDFRFDDQGRIVFVSYHDPRVLMLGDDDRLHVLAGADDGVVGIDGNEGDGGPALEALFIQLDGMALGPDGSIYVSDSLANRVRRIDPSGMIDTIAGTGVAELSGDGGPGVDAALHWPTAMELDPAGNLLIADTRNNVVRRLDADGTIHTIAGTGTAGFSGDGGPATQAQLDQPYGLALDEDGTLYVADRGNFRVRSIAPDGTIHTIAGTGLEGLRGDGGPALSARLGYVARLAMDGDGLLVADQSNSVARRIVLR